MVFYLGDIAGTFWGGQTPSDASAFGIQPTFVYSYLGCGCEGPNDITIPGANELYCACYRSIEEHRAAFGGSSQETTWCAKNIYIYEFESKDIETVQDHVADLTRRVGQFLKTYEIVDEQTYNADLLYQHSIEGSPTVLQTHLLARLCLAKQILHCLEKYESCSFEVNYGFVE